MMAAYIRNPLTYLWFFLFIATVASWWLGVGHGADAALSNVIITAVVVLFALIKTRFVMRHYMEVRLAPLWLKLSCDAWLLGLLAMIAVFYRIGL
jgi:hypothetical protein